MAVRILLTCVALSLMAASASAQKMAPSYRVRPADNAARRLLAAAWEGSATVRDLVGELEKSNLIVLVEVGPRERGIPGHHGSIRLLTVAGGQRYVAVWIDSLWASFGEPRRRVALLAHELKHAAEIARARGVVDEAGMLALFKGIGWQTSSRTFETDGALDVEARVLKEQVSATSQRPQAFEPAAG